MLANNAPANADAGKPGAESLDAVWYPIVARVRARRDEIEAAIFARIRDHATDGKGLEDVQYVQGLRQTVGVVLDYVLAGIDWSYDGGAPGVAGAVMRSASSSLPSPPSVPSLALVQARRAARAGVSLETVVRRYVTGYTLLEDFFMREVEHDELLGRIAVLRGVLDASAALLDRLIEPVIGAYKEEEARLGYPRRAFAASSASSRISNTSIFQSDPRVAARQRARILSTTVAVVAERGFAGASVGLVVARAKVSRRTFYTLFSGLESCLLEVIDEALERSNAIVAGVLDRGASWRETIRLALASMLVFFDSEPELARVCIVESLAAGPVVRRRRADAVADFRARIVARVEHELTHPSALIAQGLLASAIGLIHEQLIKPTSDPEPLIGLLGPLTGVFVSQFADKSTSATDVRLADELARKIQAGDPEWLELALIPPRRGDAARDDTSTVTRAHARECLLYLAANPDASNREIAAGIGVTHQSQISRLLSELAGDELVSRRSEGVGRRNAWRLTSRGSQIAGGLGEG